MTICSFHSQATRSPTWHERCFNTPAGTSTTAYAFRQNRMLQGRTSCSSRKTVPLRDKNNKSSEKDMPMVCTALQGTMTIPSSSPSCLRPSKPRNRFHSVSATGIVKIVSQIRFCSSRENELLFRVGRFKMLHAHIFFTAPLGSGNMAKTSANKHQCRIAVWKGSDDSCSPSNFSV